METASNVESGTVIGDASQEPLTQLTVERKNEITKYAGMVPELRRTLFTRACEGSVSPRQAIKAKCQECVGYEEITSRVGGCEVRRCPLWAYRPYQRETEETVQ